MKTTKNIIFNSITWYAYAFSLILSLTLFALNFSLYLFACLLPFSFTLSLCHFASPSFPSCLPCASFLSHFLLSCIVFIIFNAFILFCITDYNLHITFYYFLLFSSFAIVTHLNLFTSKLFNCNVQQVQAELQKWEHSLLNKKVERRRLSHHLRRVITNVWVSQKSRMMGRLKKHIGERMM